MLLLSFGPSRWRWLVGGASREEVETAFAGWEMLAVEPADTAGLGWPMNKTAPRRFRLRQRASERPAVRVGASYGSIGSLGQPACRDDLGAATCPSALRAMCPPYEGKPCRISWLALRARWDHRRLDRCRSEFS